MEEVPDNFSNKEVRGETEGNEVDKTINVELIVEKPAVGMSFSSVNDLEFYTRYGKELGFGICKRSSTKDDNGDVKYLTIVCSREGKGHFTPQQLSDHGHLGSHHLVRQFGACTPPSMFHTSNEIQSKKLNVFLNKDSSREPRQLR
ncbi:hypothetical protein IFM89_018543 [Coptis chinensis]|uniref:FAR1 domain-containing protein n=1 Tax=Coptis chinensis TaxID=261450 RepID=A0A835IEP5_9MAGN|nr:hypothetical protein IFM89_018543 [Coptis chinensis]